MKFLALVFFCLCLPLRAADWYVDAAAAGSANGTSWTNAWTNTTNIVWASVNSGDTLWVRQGSYDRLSLSNEDGVTVKIDPAATGPAIFRGASLPSQIFSSDDVLFDGLVGSNKYLQFSGNTVPYPSGGTLLTLKSSRRITLRGLTVKREDLWEEDGNAVNGITLANSTVPACEDITIEDCYIGYVNGDGVNINKSGPSAGWDKYMIRRCTIFNVGDDGVQHSGNCTLLDNYIDQNGVAALFANQHPDGVQVGIGGSYTRVEGNLFKDFSQCIFVERAKGNVKIINNICVGNGTNSGLDCGMNISVLDPEVASNAPIYVPFEGEYILANNVVYQYVTQYGINGGGSIERLVPSIQRVVGNNIFVNCKQIMHSGSDGMLDATNIWFDLPGVQYYHNTVPVSIAGIGDRKVGLSINADPRFVSPSTDDFTLAEGSPAIGTGTNFSDYFTTDKNGDTRPAEPTAWDAGAIIYDSGSAPADVTAPTLLSTTISPTGDSMALVYSESVVGVDAAHYSITGGSTLSAATGSDANWSMTLSPIETSDAVVTISYTSGASRTADTSGNLMATITNAAVINGSLETTPVPPNAPYKGVGKGRVPAGR